MPSVRDVRVPSDLPTVSRVVTSEAVKAYADAGGDQNPLHQDAEFARAAGFPGIIAHGMFTMGHLAAGISRWAGGPERIRRLTAQFRAPVFMDEEIVAGGRVTAVDAEHGIATIECWVSLERDGRTEWPIKRGEAEVLLDP
jgi:acyl dehydratase